MGRTGIGDEVEDRWIASLDLGGSRSEPLTTDWVGLLHRVFTTHGPVDWDVVEVIAGLATLEAAGPACGRVAADVWDSIGEAIALCIVEDGSVLRIEVDGQWADGCGVTAVGVEELTVEVADGVQDQLMERLWRAWPECARHRRGLHPELNDGAAVWSCSAGPHAVARIGQLADQRRSKAR